MKIENSTETESPPNLMPLIDMVFLLLIFFLVATTFSQEERELDVNLPGTSHQAKPLSAPPPQFIINILHDGEMKVAGESLSTDKLGLMLKTIARDEPERVILIRVDQESKHKFFAQAADLCRQAGIDKTKIGYVVEGAPASPAAPAVP
jgi:biopolymer transport protein ExbD